MGFDDLFDCGSRVDSFVCHGVPRWMNRRFSGVSSYLAHVPKDLEHPKTKIMIEGSYLWLFDVYFQPLLGKVCRRGPPISLYLKVHIRLHRKRHDFIPMTDLLHTIPDFPTNLYTHLLPSLEKHRVTTTDLLTLDALEVAKRAQLPLLDVRRLVNHVVAILQSGLGLKTDNASLYQDAGEGEADYGSLRKTGKEAVTRSHTISTLDPSIDAALGGGIPTGYVTEITGERCGP